MAKGQDKCKRDEWSDAGILSLLEIYEAKWLLRNRAKLKGSDWEDIARQVSVRSSGTKTPNQCKNKIESMKKRYRTEAAAAAAAKHPSACSSSWQFFARMDSLVKGAPNCSAQPRLNSNLNLPPKGETDLEAEGRLQCSHREDGSNSIPADLNADDVNNNEEEEEEKKESKGTDGDESADSTAKRRKGGGCEVAESIRLLARSILKIEETRMEMYKDSERTRLMAEIKKSEMELKRTEIVAQTQLQIAELFVKRSRPEKRDGVDAQPRPDHGMGD